MDNENSRQNLKTIAKLAGVSHSTVSRVINNSALVKETTRAKILKIIEESNFSPNAAARALISGKTYTIGLLLTFDSTQFPSDFLQRVLQGMTPVLNENGYSLILLFDIIGNQKDRVSLDALRKYKMDGLFILSVSNIKDLEKKINLIEIPKIYLNLKPENEAKNYVIADEFGGAVAAVEHLIKNGHKKIGFIGGTPKFTSSIERRNGYLYAIKKHDLESSDDFEKTGYFDVNKGYIAMKELLNQQNKITAVFCANDLMALGAVKAINDSSLKVPDDIAVVGFDNQEFAEFVTPALTTVKKPRSLMGELGAINLIKLINGESSEINGIILQPELIVRKSSV